MSEEDKSEVEEKSPTAKVVPIWFYKILFTVASKVATWAADKAGIVIDQHERAKEGTGQIKEANDDVEDKPVNPDERPDDDIFNNNEFNS
jgi:hypothetical protein